MNDVFFSTMLSILILWGSYVWAYGERIADVDLVSMSGLAGLMGSVNGPAGHEKTLYVFTHMCKVSPRSCLNSGLTILAAFD